jgi:hypothetical protein
MRGEANSVRHHSCVGFCCFPKPRCPKNWYRIRRRVCSEYFGQRRRGRAQAVGVGLAPRLLMQRYKSATSARRDYNRTMAECVRCGAETDLWESGLPVCMNCIDQVGCNRPQPEHRTPAKQDEKPEEARSPGPGETDLAPLSFAVVPDWLRLPNRIR